ncbi:reverse transcriptase domain-containing protein [Rummeliibacillus sp. G93]|uniref:reverse transcriptase domain-containing protein n=1 Tax=Rummeliibacillus sp. G93 TaxID=2939494 RepID=UPI00201C0313|nr:reverse transcriptase domain-containing protein [Rummeliibacillus sp. G93]UQW96677.1 reverse transcriptase domain-containing protein [Rummeliibacillus sp. G93]
MMFKQANQILYDEFKKENILELYNTYITNSTAVGIDKMTKKIFERNLDEHIDTIQRKVIDGSYRFTYYKEKLIIKNRNSYPRMISIPTIRDKIVLKKLQILLRELFEINPPLVQTVIQNIKNQLNSFSSFIKIDISNFYGSLNHNILKKRLKTKIKKTEIRNLLMNAIQNPTVPDSHTRNNSYKKSDKGVPQGLPIANTLAEIYMKKLDDRYGKKLNLRYFRYVDDILILCDKSELTKIKQDILNDLKLSYELPINTDKTIHGDIKEGFEFLGYAAEFNEKKNKMILTIKKSAKLKFEQSLVDLFAKYSKSNISPQEFMFYLNLKITGSISKKVDEKNEKIEKKFGWLFFYSQLDDVKYLHHLDYLVEKFIDQYNLRSKFEAADAQHKKFYKAYYEIIQNRSKSQYIFKPDDLSIFKKKQMLINVFKVSKSKLNTEESIERIFKKKVFKPIKYLHKDIQHLGYN